MVSSGRRMIQGQRHVIEAGETNSWTWSDLAWSAAILAIFALVLSSDVGHFVVRMPQLLREVTR